MLTVAMQNFDTPAIYFLFLNEAVGGMLFITFCVRLAVWTNTFG